ncbi:two-component system response regulator ChvI [Rhizomicrobium palustre]|uniref:Two-component system response regulator ChvI n=1 Tax=Rhizomicrobium palustre TaxID=189966 RepID=A0A846N063_9PROT|nr:response regulator transcription factor [Rhizomicrobium palustre]NIK89076.1 two-component system response regulator ChvI [Rhizomicrobium palustre]
MDQVSRQSARGHILVVDDDELFRESVSTNLVDAGYSTDSFADGTTAVNYLTQTPEADILLLDWKMPGMTGIEVLQRLRQEKIDIPVIFLTVLNDQIFEEAGLLGGAVDFIEKSRSFSILLKRIELILSGNKARNVPAPDSQDMARYGDIVLRFDSRRALWKGSNVGLTLTEFNIVAYLIEHSDRDVSYREIYDLVHGEGFLAGDGEIGYRTNVRAFIKRIRQKFRDLDAEFSQITNYPGFGYRWRNGSEQ